MRTNVQREEMKFMCARALVRVHDQFQCVRTVITQIMHIEWTHSNIIICYELCNPEVYIASLAT